MWVHLVPTIYRIPSVKHCDLYVTTGLPFQGGSSVAVVCAWVGHMWYLFYHCSSSLLLLVPWCFVIVAFSGYLHLYFTFAKTVLPCKPAVLFSKRAFTNVIVLHTVSRSLWPVYWPLIYITETWPRMCLLDCRFYADQIKYAGTFCKRSRSLWFISWPLTYFTGKFNIECISLSV